MLLIRLPDFFFFNFLSMAAAHKANISIKFAMIGQYSLRVDPSALMNVIFPAVPPSSHNPNMQNSLQIYSTDHHVWFPRK